MTTIKLEPNWEGMFRYAIRIATREIPEERGQEVVVRMLEYGTELVKQYEEGSK
tara:strand:- start:2532 stop:2693 length:162 start_codon:yes stop_codon:yes gene_type:complete